VQRSAAKSRPC